MVDIRINAWSFLELVFCKVYQIQPIRVVYNKADKFEILRIGFSYTKNEKNIKRTKNYIKTKKRTKIKKLFRFPFIISLMKAVLQSLILQIVFKSFKKETLIMSNHKQKKYFVINVRWKLFHWKIVSLFVQTLFKTKSLKYWPKECYLQFLAQFQ